MWGEQPVVFPCPRESKYIDAFGTRVKPATAETRNLACLEGREPVDSVGHPQKIQGCKNISVKHVVIIVHLSRQGISLGVQFPGDPLRFKMNTVLSAEGVYGNSFGMQFWAWASHLEDVLYIDVISPVAYCFPWKLLCHWQEYQPYTPELPLCGALPTFRLWPAAWRFGTRNAHAVTSPSCVASVRIWGDIYCWICVPDWSTIAMMKASP